MTDRRPPRRAQPDQRGGRGFRPTTDPTDPRNRLFAIAVVFSIFGGILTAQLVKLQAVRPDLYVEEGRKQRTAVNELEAYRGEVVDRNGFVLAASIPSYEVVVNPTALVDPDKTAELLAQTLELDLGKVTSAVQPNNSTDQYGLVARSVGSEQALRVEALFSDAEAKQFMAGVFVEPDEHRIYPAGDLAKPLVGRVDPDEVGIFGIERQFDDAMTGQAGFEQFERGRFGSITSGQRLSNPAEPGFDVVLTIDHRVQFVAEEALLKHCNQVQAKGATAVLTEPETGNVLAMASVVRGEDGTCFVPNYNKALVEWFEPGSVLKPVTAAAAIEELGYTPSTMIQVPPKIKVGDVWFSDDPKHDAAPFSMAQILANSMNVGTITMAQAVGPDLLYEYQTRFGLGAPTGLDWPDETPGLVKSPDDWWGSDAGSIAIGQGITVTATQLVALYNTIANDGEYHPVRLVDSLRAPSGALVPIVAEPSRTVITADTANKVTELMNGVVNEGTGKSAAIGGYQVAGKTGTAWKVFDDGTGNTSYGNDSNRRYVVTFAGFVPSENPALSMVIVVDEPTTQTSAAAVAAPIFSEVGLYALQILGVAPDQSTLDDGERVRAPAAKGLSIASATAETP